MSSVRIDDPEGERSNQEPEAARQYVPRTGAGAGAYFRDPRLKSPALATLMSIVPGLGQIYIGYYGQGFLNIVVVASIITILARRGTSGLQPFFAIFLAFFWLYNIVDASRRAALYNQALEGLGPGELPDIGMPQNRGSLFWGGILIVVGALALSHTAFGFSLEWLERWWPVAFMIAGGYLIYKSMANRTEP